MSSKQPVPVGPVKERTKTRNYYNAFTHHSVTYSIYDVVFLNNLTAAEKRAAQDKDDYLSLLWIGSLRMSRSAASSCD